MTKLWNYSIKEMINKKIRMLREFVKFTGNNDIGQVLIITAFLVMSALLCLGLTIDVGQLLIHNIQLQNAADAGAYRGGQVMATAVNTIITGNNSLILLGILSVPTKGKTLKAIRAVQAAQDAIVQTTPVLSAAMATNVAVRGNNVDLALPLNRFTSNSFLPDLMVDRVHFLPFLFGRRFPLWIADNYRSSSSRPHGDRFLRLGVTTGPRSPVFLGRIMDMEVLMPRSLAGAESYIEGGRFWPWPRATYEAKLSRMSAGLLSQLGLEL